ncbi:MAG TPA: ABC transporter substrate-binding protein [Anaerovoracaceae bacterium]|nr:ABC transporter substrate-binding protein [Anaerovoracaceae bacterium]
MFQGKTKVRIAVILSLALLLTAALAGCGGGGGGETTGDQAEAKTVKLGFLWPLTGGSATIGSQHNDGALLAIEKVNAAGGIKSMGGAQIEPIVADTESVADKGATQAERLILEEEVCAIVGAYNSGVCFAASEVADRNATPWISMGGVKNEITDRGLEWVFRINNKQDYDAKETVDAMLAAQKESNYGEIKTYTMLYDSGDWGAGAAKVFKKFADELGWVCVVDEPVTSNTPDYNAQVLKLKKANADFCYVNLYTPDALIFFNTVAANKFQPPFGIWSGGGGTEDPTFLETMNSDYIDYLFVQDDFDAGGPSRVPWIKDLAAECKEKYGYEMNAFFAQGYTAAMVAYAALEAAGSDDKEAIKTALQGLDIDNADGSNTLIATGYQRVKFDESGQNTFSHGTISQRQDGKRITLYPLDNRGEGAVILPIPAWDQR